MQNRVSRLKDPAINLLHFTLSPWVYSKEKVVEDGSNLPQPCHLNSITSRKNNDYSLTETFFLRLINHWYFRLSIDGATSPWNEKKSTRVKEKTLSISSRIDWELERKTGVFAVFIIHTHTYMNFFIPYFRYYSFFSKRKDTTLWCQDM